MEKQIRKVVDEPDVLGIFMRRKLDMTRHQIRVHMASIGHPLVGDVLYGQESERIDRTALHAWRCSLYQPFTGEHLVFEDKMPKDMEGLVDED